MSEAAHSSRGSAHSKARSEKSKGRLSHKSAGSGSGSKSLVSSTSSMHRQRLELAKIEAALQVQQRFADKEKELRLQELELTKRVEAMKIERESKLQQLKIEKELAEARAVMEVFSSVDVDKSSMDLSEISEDKQGLMDKFLEAQQSPTSVQSDNKSVMSLSDIEKTTVMSSENGQELNDRENAMNKSSDPSVGSRCESACRYHPCLKDAWPSWRKPVGSSVRPTNVLSLPVSYLKYQSHSSVVTHFCILFGRTPSPHSLTASP